MSADLRASVVQEFERRFGTAPRFVVRAPGRVNLIGEHTDYNDGFVLPMAIERSVWIALGERGDRRVMAYSIDFEDGADFGLDDLSHGGPAWSEYLKGTAWALRASGAPLAGWRGVIASDVPIGAGLSSSAALELATARAFAAVSSLPWDPASMARTAQRAENDWVGMNCGIMDQMISAAGEAGRALLIDCRTLETRAVPLPEGTVVVILDTATRRGLVDSAYNERRRQCEAAAAHFGVAALRDVSEERFADECAAMDALTARRARHVVTENARAQAAAEAMLRGDAALLGSLMDASHRSLCGDFEVSSRALDVMVEVARRQPGCFGARMTGAGFGGCAVALVDRTRTDDFVKAVTAEYEARIGLSPHVYVTAAADGASLEILGDSSPAYP